MTATAQIHPPILRRETPPPLGRLYVPAQRQATGSGLEERSLEELRRDAPDLGASGVHPKAVVCLITLYGLLVCSFWTFFGDRETALTLAVISILATMFFGLLGGGILLADSVPKGQSERRFADFLHGRVLIATGWIEGREAFAQIATLPAALLMGSIAFGAIWRLTTH
jgi:hypothetical protein